MKPNNMSKTITEVFMDLVHIPSPSGNEKKVAEYVTQFLKPLGWNTFIDDKGNVIARTSHRTVKPVVFVAHMDTVQKPGEIVRPQFDGIHFTSDGTTILGADDKASVAVLLALARSFYESKTEPPVVLIFTTREEAGTMSSSALSFEEINPLFICNVDGSNALGTIDYRSYGQTIFELSIHGKAAHAAIEPEKGVHAISILARIVSGLRMGKSKSRTLNIGSISGGGATNIVPATASVRGEVRSYRQAMIKSTLDKILQDATRIAKKYGATARLKIVENTPPFIGAKSSFAVSRVVNALKKSGVAPIVQSATYTSDSGYLSASGYPTVTLCKGGLNPHSTSESITLVEMEMLLEIVQKIIID
ncbi:MAG: M20/M25/M40 family metallo-hydrolase [Patescibacteria group bacterium]|jgi:tripeptide aminopeptidase